MSFLDHVETASSMYAQGCTLEQIGGEFGVSRERVRQVFVEKGVDLENGGARLRAKMRCARVAAEKNAKALSRYGMTLAEFRRIHPKGSKNKNSPIWYFIRQRANAKTRDIAWEMTFAEWWQIWQRSGHWNQRGRGKYVMARIGDSGPYAVGNVHVATASQNLREAIQNHAKRGIGWGAKHPNHRYYHGEQI